MFYEVIKVQGGFGVQDWNGDIVVAYKGRKLAEQYAFGSNSGVFTAAEIENERRDYIKAYIAARADRAPVINNQMELF